MRVCRLAGELWRQINRSGRNAVGMGRAEMKSLDQLGAGGQGFVKLKVVFYADGDGLSVEVEGQLYQGALKFAQAGIADGAGGEPAIEFDRIGAQLAQSDGVRRITAEVVERNPVPPLTPAGDRLLQAPGVLYRVGVDFEHDPFRAESEFAQNGFERRPMIGRDGEQVARMDIQVEVANEPILAQGIEGVQGPAEAVDGNDLGGVRGEQKWGFRRQGPAVRTPWPQQCLMADGLSVAIDDRLEDTVQGQIGKMGVDSSVPGHCEAGRQTGAVVAMPVVEITDEIG